jgi:hypothetical protein
MEEHSEVTWVLCTYIVWHHHGEPYRHPGVIDPLSDAGSPEEDLENNLEDDDICLILDLSPYASKRSPLLQRNTFH